MAFYQIRHKFGHVTTLRGTYDEACAAVRAIYQSAAIGHDGDISHGGARTLCWTCDEVADGDDGTRACCSIVELESEES